jgi:asparagine synthase (glutamine-hydrolysing)
MCGIVGILKFDPNATVEEARLKRMRDVLRHRGPDEEGLMLSASAGFGHRRLSIIDIAGGKQPMANPDKSVWITFNGEIYNFKELRADLEAGGYHFVTQSDTEVILRAYEVYGEECVDKLRGMFAFAIWDKNRSKLFLARDRLGIKPLYYAITGKEVLFASEIKAILDAGSIQAELNTAILPEFLATRFSAGAETFFKGIRKLLPGRTLSWSPEQGFQGRRYWRLPSTMTKSGETFEECARTVRESLEQAVSSHLVGDVPVGLFLSGGIDSTALAALMAPMLKRPIQTFSVGFSDRRFNEFNYARLAAKTVGANHHEVTVTPEDFFRALPSMLWHEDEPIAFPSSISLYFVADLARKNKVKVVLSGEGADELFLGYNRYRITAFNEKFGQLYWAVMPAFLGKIISRLTGYLPRFLRRYSARSFLALKSHPRELFFENFAVFPEHMHRDLLVDADKLGVRDPYGVELRCYDEVSAGTMEKMTYSDIQTYLVELLMKQDQMSMAASVESRVPFLDHRIVEYAAAMPGKYKLRGSKTKLVLREALRDLVPRRIMSRSKMGFPTPISEWLRKPFLPLLQEFVTGPRALQRGLFVPETVRRLVEEHRSGARDHGDRLWLLINLEIWQRIFIDGENHAEVMDVAVRPIRLNAAA